MTIRGQTITVGTELVTETCCSCGVLFAMPAELVSKRQQDEALFYCPSGHPQHYTDSEASKLRKKLQQAEDRAAALRAETDQAWARAEELSKEAAAERRRAGAAKGQLTKAKRRMHAGICPECQRTFANVADHMQTDHPGAVAESALPDRRRKGARPA